MKKILAVLLALGVGALALTGCQKDGAAQPGSSAADTVIKIGLFEPLTGEDAAGGNKEALGIEFANTLQNTVELGGKTYTVELFVSDNASSPAAASAAAYELVGEGCDIVLGSNRPDVTAAAAGVFAKSGIGMLGASGAGAPGAEAGGNVLDIGSADLFEGKVLAAYALEHYSASTVYILMKNGDERSGQLGGSFKDTFMGYGGTVAEGRYQDGNSDFTDYLAAAAEAGAAVLFAPIPAEDAGLLFTQASGEGTALPMLAWSDWDDDGVLAAVQGTTLDVNIPAIFNADIQTDAGIGFVTAFRQWLTDNPDKLTDNGGTSAVSAATALGYDAYMMALEAIEAAGSGEAADILAALRTATYGGATGSITVTQSGEAVRDGACILHAETAGNSWRYVTYQKIR